MQGRSDGGGVYRYIYPPKSVYLANFDVVVVFLFDPGQIQYRASVRLSKIIAKLKFIPPPQKKREKFLATPLIKWRRGYYPHSGSVTT